MPNQMTNAEVDRFLAERLMGLKLQGISHESTSCQYLGYIVEGIKDLWSPTRKISQALGNGGEGTVVGRMKQLGWYLSLEEDPSGPIGAYFTKWPEFIESVLIRRKDPSEAISRAAVEALRSSTPASDKPSQD